MRHVIRLNNPSKSIYELGRDFRGESPDGEQISFTNYYMQVGEKPFYGISGEFHFSRYAPEYWEDELIKMKAGGVNVVSTYIFWNHHEEAEGVFNFEGRRNLRRFVELCRRHNLYVIVRIGPFDHGEVRNGGFPDWLYGKPFEPRAINDGFLACVKKLYCQIHAQLDGLYYRQGGPIIAAQMDNEYMHSAAPWEYTTGISNEWISHGDEGDTYMLRLRDLARETGIDAPFYTCTGWGGAATPKELMPLWGGYAFRPWLFYSHTGSHPATEEYIYRDNHNNAVPATYNFEPFYEPESKPYLCCEMGGGMTCCYYYRFQLPYESVDAMANIKLGSGCNMLGYYMYHGGTNPTGETVQFLNEAQVPKLSYDYQAPLGEFGQVRRSYNRLRVLHYFTQACTDILCRAKTFLPENSQSIEPEDTRTLRWAVRATEQGQGFVFLNNYQDHAETVDKRDEELSIELPGRTVAMGPIDIAAGENCILPFNLEICGIPLDWALAQYITSILHGGEATAFFFIPDGMSGRYCFAEGVTVSSASDGVRAAGRVVDVPTAESSFAAAYGDLRVTVVTLTRAQSEEFYVVDTPLGEAAVLTKAAVLQEEEGIRLEHDANRLSVSVYPAGALAGRLTQPPEMLGLFALYTLEKPAYPSEVAIRQVGKSRYLIDMPDIPEEAKQTLLQITYHGDIGSAFIDGKMISDNFANGAPWEIGLREHAKRLKEHPLTLYISPLREGSTVNVESVMAGRKEEAGRLHAGLDAVSLKHVYEWSIS